jgi:hypothetical protein
MKIISKFKDYYDYLQGIYGIDEKLILDRTKFVNRYPYGENAVVRFFICGVGVEGLFRAGKFWYGNELEQFSDKKHHFWGNSGNYYFVKPNPAKLYGGSGSRVLKVPMKFKDWIQVQETIAYQNRKVEVCPNDKYDCPILVEDHYYKTGCYEEDGFCQNPILSEYQFHKVFSAQDIWFMLTEWLGREKQIKEMRSDKEKLLSNGFDLKTSFRHPIK